MPAIHDPGCDKDKAIDRVPVARVPSEYSVPCENKGVIIIAQVQTCPAGDEIHHLSGLDVGLNPNDAHARGSSNPEVIPLIVVKLFSLGRGFEITVITNNKAVPGIAFQAEGQEGQLGPSFIEKPELSPIDTQLVH